jgi:hypothetical protein
MSALLFDWDGGKAAQNEANHGVASKRQSWSSSILSPSNEMDDREDYGEDRHVILGIVDGMLLYVAYTMRRDTIRIISARGAEPHERRKYHEENG